MNNVPTPHAGNAPQAGHRFDLHHVLDELKHYLPSQTPLKDFIHHNSLHAFQSMKFYDAIFTASEIFGYQVTLELEDFRKLFRQGRVRRAALENVITQRKGIAAREIWSKKLLFQDYNQSKSPRVGRLREQWKSQYHIDIDTLVQPLLFRIFNAYLDQGISLWKFPTGGDFLSSIRSMERNSYASIFKTSRARTLLHDEFCTITTLLELLVGNEQFYQQYIVDQQFSHRGWSGMVATLEARPDALLDTRRIALHDTIFLELLLEIDALDDALGKSWAPICEKYTAEPIDLFADAPYRELNEVLSLWQDAFEWSYYDEVLSGMQATQRTTATPASQKSFQAIFCIDERECSLRRHIESVDTECETLGTPGFFGVEFYFQPMGAKFYDKLCPAPVTPKYLIKETDVHDERPHELLYTPKTHTLIPGFLATITLGFAAGIRLFFNIFRPKMSPAISNAFTHMNKTSLLTIENKHLNDRENGLQIGYTIEEMTTRVEAQLRSVGLLENFAPLVYLVAHGSSSANNPHHGAHDCGACSGRPGSVNARVMASMANHPIVRKNLHDKGITIPASTQFVGALHDTAGDEIEYYDEHFLSPENSLLHSKNCASFEKALDLNAKERSRRFASIPTSQSLKKVRKAIKDRSVSLFEPRPELGHGTNTLCIVGRREMTKRLFLDRRAFLNSYDYRTDPEGKILAGVMRPLGPVCGGINLEYYFSRVDNHKLGAGTKLPHHVMGLIGVTNSYDGDLRPGLPLQMIEVHDPVRLLIIVEHFPEVVLATIQSAPEMYEWFINEWVNIAVLHPETKALFRFRAGQFEEYSPLAANTPIIKDFEAFIEEAQEMETNYIADATKENLPVYSLQ